MSKSIAVICAYNDYALFQELTKTVLDNTNFTNKIVLYDNTDNRLFKDTVDLFNCTLLEHPEDILIFVHQDINGEWGQFGNYVLNWQEDWGLVGATDERKSVTKIHGRLETEPKEVQLIDGHCMGGRRELFANISTNGYWAQGCM
jgi:hypothetical protein